MSDEQQVFSVAELVDAVGVPRTTINDWLARYAKYIDFETRGKRKVYFPSSVTVLQEISQLRNEGKSSFEIEDELMRNHPLRPDPVENADASSGENASSDVALVRQPPDEIAKIFNREIQHLSARFEAFDRMDNTIKINVRRLYLPLVLGFCGLFIFGMVAILFVFSIGNNFNNQQLAANQNINKKLDETEKALAEAMLSGDKLLVETQLEKLKELTRKLEDDRNAYRADLDKLRTEMLEERKQFAAELEKERQSLIAKNQSEMQNLRTDYERRLTEKEQESQQIRTNLTNAEQQLSQLRGQNIEQGKFIQQLSEKLNQPPENTPRELPIQP